MTCTILYFKSLNKILGFKSASRPSSISIVNMFSLCTFKKKKFVDFIKKSWIYKNLKTFTKIKNFNTIILIIHKPSLGSREVSYKIWARSVQPFWLLTFIGHKQTNKQAKYIQDIALESYHLCPMIINMAFMKNF